MGKKYVNFLAPEQCLSKPELLFIKIKMSEIYRALFHPSSHLIPVTNPQLLT